MRENNFTNFHRFIIFPITLCLQPSLLTLAMRKARFDFSSYCKRGYVGWFEPLLTIFWNMAIFTLFCKFANFIVPFLSLQDEYTPEFKILKRMLFARELAETREQGNICDLQMEERLRESTGNCSAKNHNLIFKLSHSFFEIKRTQVLQSFLGIFEELLE